MKISNVESYPAEPLSSVKLKEISLHSGPGLSYPVIETLKRNQKVKQLAKKGEWVKVKVLSSGTIGYCNLAGIN
ncbi:SH3 domain-containing protein [Pedobacter ghigonis]|uniref:SH3 domain-containing protein n=1 Tax=Pedobacter ghigonis TaxID=2730403 RepID=UPI00158EDB12|nr:SH3 domain-containing protein [Pedobacter ghigonis]